MLFEYLGEVARNITRAADAQESVPLAKAFAVDRKVILQIADVLPQTLQAGLQPVPGAVCVENPRSLVPLENPRFGRISATTKCVSPHALIAASVFGNRAAISRTGMRRNSSTLSGIPLVPSSGRLGSAIEQPPDAMAPWSESRFRSYFSRFVVGESR